MKKDFSVKTQIDKIKDIEENGDRFSVRYFDQGDRPPSIISALEEEPVIMTLVGQTYTQERVVSETHSVAIRIGGDNQILLPGKVCGDTNSFISTSNGNAISFVGKYKEHVHSVAAIIQRSNNGWKLVGSAGLVKLDVLLTASHVLNGMFSTQNREERLNITESGFFAVFNLHDKKFPNGIPANYNFSTDPDAISLKVGLPILRNDKNDVGLIRLPQQLADKKPFSVSGKKLMKSDELALIGIPGKPAGVDSFNPYQYDDNYMSCGIENPRDAVVLRIGTGIFMSYSGNTCKHENRFCFNIDTMGGNSGSPIFNARSGEIVGINVATTESLETIRHDGKSLGINLAAPANIIVSMLDDFN